MDAPKLLAIDDVHLTARLEARQRLSEFYVGLLGFEQLPDQAGAPQITLRGLPRAGPRLVISLTADLPDKPPRTQALIQVPSLRSCADALAERRIEYVWSTGWFFYDRRLTLLDPGGNRIELVASHPW